MPKNLFQDMVKVKNSSKSARKSIPRYSNVKKNEEIKEFKKPIGANMGSRPRYTEQNLPPYLPERESNKRPSRHGLWLVAFISIIFFVFALSFFFAKAEVYITPRMEDVAVDENLYAIKDSNTEDLSFDLVIISGEESKKVFGSEQKEVALSSGGSVVIYNAFGSASQKLAINTKLEGSNGKIYKIVKEITIPGVAEDGTPGSLQVDIVASEPGKEYDSVPLDFKIVGFKGTSKYEKFYARSLGEITGGYRGFSPVVSDVDKENALIELRSVLQERLLQKAIDQIPDGFILFKEATFLDVDKESMVFESADVDNSIPIKVEGTLYGFLMSEKKLTDKIVKASIAQYDNSPVYIPNIRDLKFSIAFNQDSFSSVQGISFNIKGKAKIVWKLDEKDFSGSILGKSKKEFNSVLSQYPNISTARLSISPLWVRSIPEKSKDVKIIVDYPMQ